MDEKHALVGSITNLINHITATQSNQQEIFNSLTTKDLHKILTNLDDPYLKLRIVTMILIAQLLYNNSKLKTKFCQLMDIYPAPGKIVISKINKIHQINPSRGKQIYTLLKTQNIEHHVSANFTIWYIDLTSKNLNINWFSKDHTHIDPINCIIGFILPSPEKKPLLNNYINLKPKYINKTQHKHTFSTEVPTKRIAQPFQKDHISNSIQIQTNNQPNIRMSLQMEDLSSKAKQGIKIISTKPKKSQLVEKKFDNVNIGTARNSHQRTITLGGNKGWQTTRQKKQISNFLVPSTQ